MPLIWSPRTRLLNTAGCILGGLLLVVSASGADAADRAATRNEVAERRADLNELRSRIGRLKKEIATDEATRSETADQLQASEQAISALQKELRQLSAERLSLLATRDQLRAQADGLAGHLDRQQEGLEAALGAIYRRRLSHGSDHGAAQSALASRYLAAAASARAAQVALTTNQLDRKQQHARDTERQALALAAIEARQQRQQTALLAQRALRERLIRKISTRLDAQRRQVSTLQQDERRLTRLVERLSRVLAARAKQKRRAAAEPAAGAPRPNVGIGAGPRRLPFALVSPVGQGRPQRVAKGLFYGVPAGREVSAAADGQVVFADWLRGFGNLMIIDHGEDFLSIYGYNESLLRQVGDPVRRGDAIATVGDSGGRGETGLYFELRHEGAAIDASRWLAQR